MLVGFDASTAAEAKWIQVPVKRTDIVTRVEWSSFLRFAADRAREFGYTVLLQVLTSAAIPRALWLGLHGCAR